MIPLYLDHYGAHAHLKVLDFQDPDDFVTAAKLRRAELPFIVRNMSGFVS